MLSVKIVKHSDNLSAECNWYIDQIDNEYIVFDSICSNFYEVAIPTEHHVYKSANLFIAKRDCELI